MTGRCYQLAAEFVSKHDDWLLVHGLVRGPGELRVGHSWCLSADGSEVYDPVHGRTLPVAVYLEGVDGQELVRYTRPEVIERMQRYGSFGPWSLAAVVAGLRFGR